MKLRFVTRIQQDDALSRPRTDPGELQKYSEWHHFNFNDDANGLYGVLNLALSGNIQDPAQGRAGVSLVVCDRKKGWRGTMNLYSIEEARFSPGSVDLQIGANSVRFRKDRYLVSAALKDGSVVLKASWTPEASAIRVDNIGGMINTFILPRLAVEGSVRIAGCEYRIEGATGYHDHNWGYWNWGTDLGWDWGYLIQSPPRTRNGSPPVSIVFGQVTDATRAAAKSDLVLLVWVGERCAQVFLDEAVDIATAGELTGVAIPRVPGVMALLAPPRVSGIPRQLRIRAEDGEDRVEIRMDVENALQFLVPHPVGGGTTTIAELVGPYQAQGVLGGRAFAFTYAGFAELAG
ncbi:MAG: hypothetical protein HYY65_11875 [Candidatus Tectomicrobia bacterium]|uniref:AttH domain-containing protein n=1 Tax=Tectimicrobiota bacterium TaxID=2528274 RepID=A0A932GQY0_UNCTE|nr:hypothetical protein [Candidatus Tectomicrobia bacterium]